MHSRKNKASTERLYHLNETYIKPYRTSSLYRNHLIIVCVSTQVNVSIVDILALLLFIFSTAFHSIIAFFLLHACRQKKRSLLNISGIKTRHKCPATCSLLRFSPPNNSCRGNTFSNFTRIFLFSFFLFSFFF